MGMCVVVYDKLWISREWLSSAVWMVVFSASTTSAVLTSVRAEGALSVCVCVCACVFVCPFPCSLWIWAMVAPFKWQSTVADLNNGSFSYLFFPPNHSRYYLRCSVQWMHPITGLTRSSAPVLALLVRAQAGSWAPSTFLKRQEQTTHSSQSKISCPLLAAPGLS